jgi:ABC-2 type transport system permease protein
MIKIALKDLKLFFIDRKSVFLTFLLPIFLISIFALAFGGNTSKKTKAVDLLVSDLDNTAGSREMIGSLDSVKGLVVTRMSLDSARQEVRKGNEAAVLIFHKGYEDSLNAGKSATPELQYDESREMEMGLLQQALISALMSGPGMNGIKKNAMKYIERDFPGMDTALKSKIQGDIAKNFDKQAGSAATGSMLKTTPIVAEKENSPGLIQAVAGTAIMMLLFSVAGMGAGLLTEKEEGTLKKLLYSPMHPNNILFGKMLAGIVMSIMQLVIMFVFASLVFGLDLSANLPGLILMILSSAVACSGFGILLASVAKSRQQVQGLSTLIVLMMSAIGGSMIPIFIMPLWMQKLAVISVNYWSIQGFYDIYWRAMPLATIAMKALILFGIGILLMLISVRLFKTNVLKIS